MALTAGVLVAPWVLWSPDFGSINGYDWLLGLAFLLLGAVGWFLFRPAPKSHAAKLAGLV